MPQYHFLTCIKCYIINYHNSIMSDRMTLENINNTKAQTIFSREPFNILTTIKNYYVSSFLMLSNVYYKTTLNCIEDSKQIDALLKNQDLDMTELRTK